VQPVPGETFEAHGGDSASGAPIPPLYRAVVEAGIRSGQLAAALEAVAGSARRVADLRRAVAAGLAYPLFVFVLAWCLAALFTAAVVPHFLPAFRGFGARGAGALAALAWIGEWAVYWGPAMPAVVVLAATAWWRWASDARMAAPGLASRLLGWLPGVGAMLRASHRATFAELLALLVESRLPLDEALRLAACACGDRPIRQAAEAAAQQVRLGRPLADAAPQLPPLVRWMILGGAQGDMLAPSLRHAAELYREAAVRRADAVRQFLPVALTLALGGAVTVAYLALIVMPWLAILEALLK
jgi:general secretion pathway protein F